MPKEGEDIADSVLSAIIALFEKIETLTLKMGEIEERLARLEDKGVPAPTSAILHPAGMKALPSMLMEKEEAQPIAPVTMASQPKTPVAVLHVAMTAIPRAAATVAPAEVAEAPQPTVEAALHSPLKMMPCVVVITCQTAATAKPYVAAVTFQEMSKDMSPTAEAVMLRAAAARDVSPAVTWGLLERQPWPPPQLEDKRHVEEGRDVMSCPPRPGWRPRQQHKFK